MKFSGEMAVFAAATIIVIIVFACSVIVISESGCLTSDSVKADGISQSALLKYQGAVQNDLLALSKIAGDRALFFSDRQLSGEEAQIALDSAQKQLPSIVTIGTFDKDGIVMAMLPSSHSEILGRDLSNTPVVSEMNAGMVPSMSNIFSLAEGGYAASINYPVFSSKKEYTGFVSLTFDPSVIIEKYALELMNDTGFQLMAAQKEGVVLYDNDPEEIGKEVFGNPMYNDYPEVLDFAKAYSESFSGEYRYGYLDKNLEKEVNKKAFWTTFGLYGTEWRLICIHEI